MKNIRKAKLLAHQNPFSSTYILSGQHSVCLQPYLLLIGVGKHIDLLKHYCISVGSALTDISPSYLPTLELKTIALLGFSSTFPSVPSHPSPFPTTHSHPDCPITTLSSYDLKTVCMPSSVPSLLHRACTQGSDITWNLH